MKTRLQIRVVVPARNLRARVAAVLARQSGGVRVQDSVDDVYCFEFKTVQKARSFQRIFDRQYKKLAAQEPQIIAYIDASKPHPKHVVLMIAHTSEDDLFYLVTPSQWKQISKSDDPWGSFIELQPKMDPPPISATGSKVKTLRALQQYCRDRHMVVVSTKTVQAY